MRKIVALFLTVTMLFTIIGTIPFTVSAATETVLLDMNFNSLTPANLLETMTDVTGSNANKVFNTDIANLKISWNANSTKKADGTAMGQDLATAKTRGYVGVVNATTEGINDAAHTGNVFKYQHVNATDVAGGSFLQVKIQPTGTDIDTSDAVVVVEYDMYMQKQKNQVAIINIANTTSDYLSNYLGLTSNLWAMNGSSKVKFNGYDYQASTNTSPYYPDGTNNEYKEFETKEIAGSWHKVKLVADMTEKSTPDTFRFYVDGELQGTKFEGCEDYIYDFLNYKGTSFTNTFAGLMLGGKTGASQPAIYYDNIKVTKYATKFAYVNDTIPDAAQFDTNYTVTFNRNIDPATASNVYVADMEGNVIEGGVTASASGNVLNVKFNDALAGLTNYNLVLPPKFTDEVGQGLVTYYLRNSQGDNFAKYINADLYSVGFATGKKSTKAIKLIDQNFENSPVDVNILASLANDKVDDANDAPVINPANSTVPGVGALITIDTPYSSATDFANSANISVVNTTKGDRTGKFLKINNNSGVATYGKRNQILGTIAPQTTDSEALNLTGSILVTEYDIYVDSDKKGSDNLGAIMAPANNALTKVVNYGNAGPYIKYSDLGSTLRIAGDEIGLSVTEKGINGWTKVRIVTDKTGATEYVRVYIGGELMSVSSNYDYPNFSNWSTSNPTLSPFSGLLFGGYGAGTGSIYYDNIKVTKVTQDFALAEDYTNAFSAFNTTTDTISLEFTTTVDANTLDEIYLEDESGKIVLNALVATIDSDDDVKVNISLDEVGKGTYNLVLPATFTDIYGQGIGTYGNETKSIPVTVINKGAFKETVLIDQNFDSLDEYNYVNEFTSAASASKTKGEIGVGMYFQKSTDTLDMIKSDASLAVVNATVGDKTGKMLKYYNRAGNRGDSSTGDGRIHIIGNILPKTGVDTDVADSIIITEYDMYLEKNIYMTGFDIPSPKAVSNVANTNWNGTLSAEVGSVDSKISLKEYYNKAATNYNQTIDATDKWVKVRIVTDTKSNSYRIYFDNKLVQAVNGTSAKSVLSVGAKRNALTSYPQAFSGLVFGGYSYDETTAEANKGTGAMYLDNIKVTKVNTKFDVVYDELNLNNIDPNTDTVEIEFTSKPDANKLGEIYLTDANGNVLTDALEANVNANNASKVTFKFVSGIKGAGNYNLVFPATFTDIYGQGLGTYGAEVVSLPIKMTASLVAKADTVYTENFEDWSDNNLLEIATAGSSKGYYVANAAKAGKDAIPVNFYSTTATLGADGNADFTNNVIKAVNAETEGIGDASRGNVLKYSMSSSAGSDFLMATLGFTSTPLDLSGKVTIIETDIYVPAGGTGDHQLPSPLHSEPFANYINTNNNLVVNGEMYILGQSGKYDTATDRTINETYVAKKTGKNLSKDWHKVKIVMTDNGTSASPENPDTWRYYIDGELISGNLRDSSATGAKDVDITYDLEHREFNYVNGKFSNYDARGIFYGILLGGKNGNTSKSRVVYYDNIKVTTTDVKFAVDCTVTNANAFDAGVDTITATFTRPVDLNTTKYINVVDGDGTIIEDAVKTIEPSKQNTVLKITLDGTKLIGNANYSISFSPRFTDVDGQGLVTYYNKYRSSEKAKSDAVWYSVNVPTTPDKVVAPFKTVPKHANVEVLYEENFDDWSNDNLLKTAAENSSLTHTSGKYYKVNAAKEDKDAIEVGIFNATANGFTVGADGNADFDKNFVQAVNAETEGVGDASRGNVLKYANTGSSFLQVALGYTSKDLTGKVTVLETDVYLPNVTRNSGDQALPSVLNSNDYNWYLSTNTNLMIQKGNLVAASGSYDNNKDRTNGAYMHKSATKALGKGQWHKVKVVMTDNGANVSVDNPDTWRVYLDGKLLEGSYRTKSSGTNLTDVKVYDFEDRDYLYTSSEPYKFNKYDSSAAYKGILLGGKGGTESTVYYDNMKVYTVDTEFDATVAVSSTERFNAVYDNIVATFTTPVDMDTVNNIIILDSEGNVIDKAIKTIVAEDDDTVLNITLDADKLIGKEEYQVIFPATFTDIYGQGLVKYYNPYRSQNNTADAVWYSANVPVDSNKLVASFKTSKANEIYVDDVRDGYDAETGVFVNTIKFNSVSKEDLPVWCAVAAYKADNSMVGYADIGDAFTLVAGETVEKEVTFTVSEDNKDLVKYIRVFVWNGFDTMKPYQQVEELTF